MTFSITKPGHYETRTRMDGALWRLYLCHNNAPYRMYRVVATDGVGVQGAKGWATDGRYVMEVAHELVR